MVITRHRRKKICAEPGCNVLISADGTNYCSKHKKASMRERLDSRKAPGSAKFYGGYKWKKTRTAYKKIHPYCEQCKRDRSIVVPGHTVHHTTERIELEKLGLDPYDFDYLEHVCFKCHNKELQKRRKHNHSERIR